MQVFGFRVEDSELRVERPAEDATSSDQRHL